MKDSSRMIKFYMKDKLVNVEYLNIIVSVTELGYHLNAGDN